MKNCSTAVPNEAVMLAAILFLLLVLMAFPAEARAVQARPAVYFDQDALALPPDIVSDRAIYHPEPVAPAQQAAASVQDFDPAAWVIVSCIVFCGVGWLVFVLLHPWRFPTCVETESEDLHSWGQRNESSKCAMPGPMQDTLNRRKD